MYIRIFLSAIDPDDLGTIKKMFDDDIRPVLSNQPGCEGVDLVANVDTNAGGLVEGAVISRWTSLHELDAALRTREVEESIVRVRQLLRQEPVRKTFRVLDE